MTLYPYIELLDQTQPGRDCVGRLGFMILFNKKGVEKNWMFSPKDMGNHRANNHGIIKWRPKQEEHGLSCERANYDFKSFQHRQWGVLYHYYGLNTTCRLWLRPNVSIVCHLSEKLLNFNVAKAKYVHFLFTQKWINLKRKLQSEDLFGTHWLSMDSELCPCNYFEKLFERAVSSCNLDLYAQKSR